MTRPRHLLVSGGSRGLGLAVVTALLEKGYNLSTFSRSRSAGMIALLESPLAADHLLFKEADLADRAALGVLVDDAVARFGPPWGLINCAGIATEGLLPLVPPDAIEETVRVNLLGPLYLTREVARKMLPQRRGRIINISSVVAVRGFKGLSVYSATKAALDGMTRSLARELGEVGITVNSIAPGYLETEMTQSLSEAQRSQILGRTPLGRLGTTEDCLAVVEFLLSERSSFLTGQTIVVDGGLSA